MAAEAPITAKKEAYSGVLSDDIAAAAAGGGSGAAESREAAAGGAAGSGIKLLDQKNIFWISSN